MESYNRDRNRQTGVPSCEWKHGNRPPANEKIAGLRGGTDKSSAATDLLFSLHGMIVAHSVALAVLRTASPASVASR
jgi:hypothetical protein